MNKLEQNFVFITTVKKFGVETEVSPEISKLNLITETAPDEDVLIEIPDEEELPIKEISDEREETISQEKFTTICYDEIKNCFAQKEKNSDDQHVQKENLRSMLPIRDAEQFVKMKREYQTYLSYLSDQNSLETPISLCKYPICLNNALPSLQYCACHIEMDPKFKEIAFVQKCDFAVNGQRCEVAVSPKYQQCSFHRAKKPKKN